MVPIAGKKQDTGNVFGVDSIQNLAALARRQVDVVLASLGAVEELAAHHDELERGRTGLERVQQPFDLRAAKHRALAGDAVVGLAEVAIVQHEERRVVPLEMVGHAADGRAEFGIRPEFSENLQRLLAEAIRPVRIVGAVVVIVPCGVMVSACKKSLQFGQLSGMAVACVHARNRMPVGFTVVDVVAQPEHEIGPLAGDCVEHLVVAAVGPPGPIVLGLVDIGARAQREGKSRRIAAPLPKRLGAKSLLERRRDGLAVDQHAVGVLGARFEAGHVDLDRVGGCRLGDNRRRGTGRQFAALGPVAQGYRSGFIGLHPDLDRPHCRMAGHRAGRQFSRLKRQQRGQNRCQCKKISRH